MKDLKQQAALRALDFVHSGMCLGLGSGSTTTHFIDLLAERLKAGELRDLRGVPTSEATASRARRLGIPLTRLSELDGNRSPYLLDLAVDGADEVDPRMNLIKGLGKALLREKLVETHARQLLIIVDESKLSNRLGTLSPLPVEIVTFEAGITVRWLNSLGCRAELWRDEHGQPYVTDNSNYLVRCWFGDRALGTAGIPDAYALARQLSDRPGVVEHGLFLDMADRVIVAGQAGTRILEREA